MKLTIKTPKQSLNKAFLKQRPLRKEIDLFKDNLTRLLGKIDEIEREENQKNLIRDFLLNTYYKESNEINTKDNKDLVIHNGKTNKESVGVIIEAKRPSNKNEMLTADKPNTKAFQELVLYYLRERIEEKNNDIKYLVATYTQVPNLKKYLMVYQMKTLIYYAEVASWPQKFKDNSQIINYLLK